MEHAISKRPAATAASTAPRHDIYAFVHKGMRAWMGDLLGRVGRTDPDDVAEIAATLDALSELLAFCRSHIAHENEFVHRAMEARRPGSAEVTAADHVGHENAIRELEGIMTSVQFAAVGGSAAALQRLYRQLARFVAENLEHMAVEESHNNLVLWETHSDDEIRGIEHALVASIPPAAMMGTLRWMLPWMNARERVTMLSGMRQGMPAEAFRAVVGMIRQHLSADEWRKLAGALRL